MTACKAALVVAFRDLTPFSYAQIGSLFGVSGQRARQLDKDGRRHMAQDLTGEWARHRIEAEREIRVWVLLNCAPPPSR